MTTAARFPSEPRRRCVCSYENTLTPQLNTRL